VKGRALVLLAAALAAAGACREPGPVVVPVSMPGVAAFPPGSFTEIVVAGFRADAPPADFDLGRELQAYLAAELERAFDGPIRLLAAVDPAAATPAFWTGAAGGRPGVVFITGSAGLTSAVRKALKGGRIPPDGPFQAAKRGVIEQLRWTLSVDLAVVSGDTGETLYARAYREDRDYLDLERPADFAFNDAAAAVRDRLFQALLGTPTIEKRSLLRR
jgi:hypothetical protein